MCVSLETLHQAAFGVWMLSNPFAFSDGLSFRIQCD